MNRRQFAITTGSLLGLAMESGPRSAFAKPNSSATGDLYARAIVLDCNLGPPLEDSLPLSQAAIQRARSSGVTVMKTSIGGFNADLENALQELAFFQRVIETHPDVYVQVRRVEDIAAAKREKRIGIIFSFESTQMLDGKLDRIELFRNLGVRVMQLSYNDTSPFGSGVMVQSEAAGLTDLGHQAVEKMNELGVAIDLSHANPATTRAAMAASKRPVLMTHGGCSAVHPHPRNKTDEQLRALANKGGVLGIYDLPYLTASPQQPQLSDYMAHMIHALDVCGEDHVGIGSDQSVDPFDTSPEGLAEFQKSEAKRHAAGIAAPEEDRPLYVEGLNVPNRCEIIADSLARHGYPARVTEKVLGTNFVRAFTEIWPGRV